MISLLITLLVILIVMGLCWWVLQQIPLPPPIGQIATVIFVVICAIVLIYFLLQLAGSGIEMPRLR
jgi:hypothetical protein